MRLQKFQSAVSCVHSKTRLFQFLQSQKILKVFLHIGRNATTAWRIKIQLFSLQSVKEEPTRILVFPLRICLFPT